jgi:hypothetical protein
LIMRVGACGYGGWSLVASGFEAWANWALREAPLNSRCSVLTRSWSRFNRKWLTAAAAAAASSAV